MIGPPTHANVSPYHFLIIIGDPIFKQHMPWDEIQFFISRIRDFILRNLIVPSLSLSCSLFLPSAQRWEKQVRAPTMWHHWPSQGVTTWCKKKGCVPHRLPLIILPTDELLIYASPTTEMLLPNEHDSNNITHRELCRHKFTHSSGGIKQCW